MTLPDATDVGADLAPSANASSQSVVRNTLAGFLSFGVNALTGFVVTPFLLWHLGASGFGLWALLLSVTGYVALVELGIGTATSREVAAAEAAPGGPHTVDEVLASSRLLYLIVSALGVAVMVPVVLFLPILINLPDESVYDARLALSILGASQAVSFYFTAYTAALIGRGKFHLFAIPSLVISLGTAALQVGVVAITGSVPALAVVTLVAAIVSSAVNRLMYVKVADGGVARLRGATRPAVRQLIRVGRYNAAMSLFGGIAYNSDLVVVGIFLPTQSVAAYAVASRVVLLVRVLSTRATDILVPTFAHTSTRDDHARSFKLFSESVLVSMTLALPACSALVFFGPGLLELWLGTPPPNSGAVAGVLAVALLVQLPAHSVFTFFSGTGQLRAMAWLGAVQAVVNLTLSVALAAAIGVIGPAVGTLVEVSLVSSCLPILACRKMGVPYRVFVRASLAPLIPALLLVAAVGWGARTWADPSPLMGALFSGVLASVSFLTVAISIGSSRRGQYASALSRRSLRG